MNNASENEREHLLLRAVEEKIVSLIGLPEFSSARLALEVVELVRAAIVEELEQAQSDAKYILDNDSSVEEVKASTDPEEIWDSCIEIASGKPTTGWWVDR